MSSINPTSETSLEVPAVEPKNFLKSWTIDGLAVLDVLALAEILTGDPWSVNGAIKFTIFGLGNAAAIAGRLRIKSSPLKLGL